MGFDYDKQYAANGEDLSDKGIEARLQNMAAKVKRLDAIMTGCAIITVSVGLICILDLSLIPKDWAKAIFWGGILIPGLIAFLTGRKIEPIKKEMKRLFTYMIKDVLSETFELSGYTASCHIKESEIKQTGLVNGWNTLSGSDLARGTYRGVRFSFSDIHLEKVKKLDDKDRTTLFKGQWLICELHREVPQPLKLRERSIENTYDKLLPPLRTLDPVWQKSDAETENAAFNKKFQIITPDPHTAFYVLTPHFMEQILALDNRADARTYMHFCGKQAHIALHNGRDLFEPNEKELASPTPKSIAALRETLKKDAKYITGTIDALLENEYLFKKK